MNLLKQRQVFFNTLSRSVNTLQQPYRTTPLIYHQTLALRKFHADNGAHGPGRKTSSYSEYKQTQGKFGKGRDDAYRAEYEKDRKKRYELKMNWGIKNRWEQRELDMVLKNRDVRQAQFRDLSKIRVDSYGAKLATFNSVDEIYFFMDEMFTAGFDEKTISIALDVFLRDFGQFEEADLEKDTFKKFVRELAVAMLTITQEKNFVKIARFMDFYCIADPNMWINLELNTIRKDMMFSASSLIAILSHFGAQQEGSQDFYDFMEFNFNSEKFKDCSTHELVTLAYSFYQVHAGSTTFMRELSQQLTERLDEKVTTFDLLRILQAFAEISTDLPQLFVQLEQLFTRRID